MPLRRGWTTGACATAAAKAAWTALLTGHFPDPVEITLPRGGTAAFALAEHALTACSATAAVVKDAGDDPDVTHGALIRVTVRRVAMPGVHFRAGAGVGTVTLPGLPIPPGEPAINPVPRRMIAAALAGIAPGGVEVEISIPGGAAMARQTLNPRLGILGGLSILGTTGEVVPYSCAAWIDSIHRGIDVARALGHDHLAGATGRTSEEAVRTLFALPEQALIDMGDFVGGMLKYLRAHPVPRITIAGGIAKMTKLAQGRLDLHSRRGEVDRAAMAALIGAPPELTAAMTAANTTSAAFALAVGAGIDIGHRLARAARQTASAVLDTAPIRLDVVLFDREGRLVGRSPDGDPG